MNVQKMLIGVATTAIGFAFGLYVYNKFLVGSPMTKSTESMEDGSTAEGE